MTLQQLTILMDSGIPPPAEDLRLLDEHGWELSADGMEARLYSEEWSNSHAAVFSTKWWITETV